MFIFSFSLQEKQALEKRVSNMEEELKVSEWKTKQFGLILNLIRFLYFFFLTCILRFRVTLAGTGTVPARPLALVLNQAELKCFCRTNHKHKCSTLQDGGCPGGLEAKRAKVNAAGSLATVFCRATSCQAEEEPVPLRSCSTSPTVGVNTLT